MFVKKVEWKKVFFVNDRFSKSKFQERISSQIVIQSLFIKIKIIIKYVKKAGLN